MFQFETQGAVEIVAIQEALNHQNVEDFEKAIEAKSFGGQPLLVIDMAGVPLVDSAALETFLNVRDRLRESAGIVKFAGLNQLCLDVFNITGVAEQFELFADTKSAIGSFVR